MALVWILAPLGLGMARILAGYWGAIPYSWPWAPMPKEQEIAMLEDEARWLERDLDSIRKRLEELRK